jgi:hypothetical protein
VSLLPTLAHDLLLLAVDGAGVRHEVGDGPLRARRDVGVETQLRHGGEALPVVADGIEKGWEAHRRHITGWLGELPGDLDGGCGEMFWQRPGRDR